MGSWKRSLPLGRHVPTSHPRRRRSSVRHDKRNGTAFFSRRLLGLAVGVSVVSLALASLVCAHWRLEMRQPIAEASERGSAQAKRNLDTSAPAGTGNAHETAGARTGRSNANERFGGGEALNGADMTRVTRRGNEGRVEAAIGGGIEQDSSPVAGDKGLDPPGYRFSADLPVTADGRGGLRPAEGAEGSGTGNAAPAAPAAAASDGGHPPAAVGSNDGGEDPPRSNKHSGGENADGWLPYLQRWVSHGFEEPNRPDLDRGVSGGGESGATLVARTDGAGGMAIPSEGAVPAWARPSQEEISAILREQFGSWRTLRDIVPRPRNASWATQARSPHSIDGRDEALTAARGAEAGARHGEGAKVSEASWGCQAMQQGMSPYPEEYLERCYDRMREGYEFGEPLRQVDVVTVGEQKAVKGSPRAVVAFMSTSLPGDVRQLQKALENLTRNFLRQHAYPVAIIHEDFSSELMETLGVLVPVPIHFVKVAFKLPDWMEPLSSIYPLSVKHFTGHPKSTPLVGYHSEMHGLLPYVKRSSFGYFHMCRFFGGAGYMLPFFDDFDFYLRLDSDSVCDKPLPDYFTKLEEANADYAFASTFLDFGEKTEGLWNFAERYMRDHHISPTFWNEPHGSGQKFQALANAKERPSYPRCAQQPYREKKVDSVHGTKIHAVPCRDRHFQAVPAFYTNFEVARIQMLRSSWYQAWFNAIDKTGSIYYSRWGDAPIRFLGLAMHLPAGKILQVQGCQHK